MNLNWLTMCAAGQTKDCLPQEQVIYLVALLIGVVVLAIIGRRARDFSTAVLSLMAVAIAINIAVGSIVYALRLPIYLDSIGTVLVAALAGPWAGALTGILSNLIWSILPIPGGASPTIAFFAPVAGVIGLMAGFWASRGVFQFRSDDARAGGFLSLAAGFVGAAVALQVVQNTIGLTVDAANPDSQNRFVLIGLGIVAVGVAVAWVTGRTVFNLKADDPRIRSYLVGATAVAAFALVVAVFQLLFGPNGYFSTVNGKDPDGDGPLGPLFGGLDLSFLAIPDVSFLGGNRPMSLIIAIVLGVVVGYLAYRWARRGEHARLFPVWIGGATTGLVAAIISAPIAAGVFGGVTGGGTDLLVALFRTLGLGVLQSALAQGLTSDPLDKTISFTVVFLILGALPVTVRTMYSRGEATVVE